MDTGGRLYNIVLSKEILEAITLHALSNEKEEVAGLLLGNWVQERSKPLEFTGFVYKFCALPRVDRKKDRVEVCDEDLVKVQEAHQNSGVNVIGWFHSHPHMTSFPSHVDLSTQKRFQQLDKRFFGIISSCFNKSSSGIEVIAFQTGEENDLVDVPLQIDDCQHSRRIRFLKDGDNRCQNKFDSRMHVLKVAFQEEKDRYRKYLKASQSSDSYTTYVHLTYQQSLTTLIEYSLDPNTRLIKDRIADRKRELELLSNSYMD